MASDFSAKQLEFTRYIRDPQANPAPLDVRPERMAMYRELIFNNIDGFLANNFPVIRALFDESAWYALVQDFFATHTCKTPYFSEIAEEFLAYLENERNCQDDFPFLMELAHYEWVEMALSISKEEIPLESTVTELSMESRITLSPLAWPLIYRFPVQRISPDFLLSEPSSEPVCLLAYRDVDDEVRFIEINVLTYRMLEIIQENAGIRVSDCLTGIVAETQAANPDAVIAGGMQTLSELLQKSVVWVSGND